VGIFKISKITLNVDFNTSLSVFKSLGKGLECFIDKFKARKAAFGVRSIREFWKISGRSLLWTTIVVHDIDHSCKVCTFQWKTFVESCHLPTLQKFSICMEVQHDLYVLYGGQLLHGVAPLDLWNFIIQQLFHAVPLYVMQVYSCQWYQWYVCIYYTKHIFHITCM